MLETTWETFLFCTAISDDFHGKLWFLNPLWREKKKSTNGDSFYNMTAECAIDVDYMYKPSFEMEWKVSPIQERTLCKGREDGGETAAFPEKEQIQMHGYTCC